MKRLMRYKTLQCFLAALIMIAFLAPSAYASGAPDTYEASANAVSEKYIGKTVPGACVVISEHDNNCDYINVHRRWFVLSCHP